MPAGKLTVTATDQGWSLAEKAGYPIDPAKVRDLALALANLQLVEAKTADPKRLERLELGEPGTDGATSRLDRAARWRWRDAGGGRGRQGEPVPLRWRPRWRLCAPGRGPSGLARRRRAGSAGRCHDADRQRACRRAAGSGGPRGRAAAGRGGRDIVSARCLGRLRHRRNPAGGPQARPGEGRIPRRGTVAG